MSHFYLRKVVYHHQSPLIIMSDGSSNEYPDSEEEFDYVSIYILMKTAEAIVEHATPLYDETLYHTSALSGEAWVLELLNGHPKHICCKLAVHKPILHALIKELSTMGLRPSWNITSKEKLSIFLYKCVTGLSVEHVGERFQHSNHTTSEYSSL